MRFSIFDITLIFKNAKKFVQRPVLAVEKQGRKEETKITEKEKHKSAHFLMLLLLPAEMVEMNE